MNLSHYCDDRVIYPYDVRQSSSQSRLLLLRTGAVSMSNDIKVGDVCEFVAPGFTPVIARYSGMQCTVLRLAVGAGLFGVKHECEMIDGARAEIAARFLRKLPPQSDSQIDDAMTPVPLVRFNEWLDRVREQGEIEETA